MGEITLRKALHDYKTIYMPYRNFADRTREEYTNDLEDFVRFAEGWGIKMVAQLGLPIVHRYVAHLEEKGFAGITRKRKVVTIRSFLLFLFQDNYITTNIASKVILPFTDLKAPHVLTQTECENLRACVGDVRDKAIIEVLLATGIRLSELTRLTVNDFDLAGESGPDTANSAFSRILVGRGKKERFVPLNERAIMAIRDYLHQRKEKGSNALFLNRFGKPLGERGVQKILRKYLKRAGIKGASIHTLRHTFAAQCIAQGTDLETLRTMMGNKDKRSVAIYVVFATRTRMSETGATE